MTFKEINRDEVRKHYKKTKLLVFLEEFQKSDLDVAIVEGHNYATPMTGVNTINASAKRFGIRVRAFRRNGNIYIEKVKE